MRLVDHLYFVAEHDDHHLAYIWELIKGGRQGARSRIKRMVTRIKGFVMRHHFANFHCGHAGSRSARAQRAGIFGGDRDQQSSGSLRVESSVRISSGTD